MKIVLTDSILGLAFQFSLLTLVHYHSFQWLLSELGFKQTNLHTGKMGEWEILFYIMNHCKTNNSNTSDDSFLNYFLENETGNLIIWIEHSVCRGYIPADRWLLCRCSNPKRNSLRESKGPVLGLCITKFIVLLPSHNRNHILSSK